MKYTNIIEVILYHLLIAIMLVAAVVLLPLLAVPILLLISIATIFLWVAYRKNETDSRKFRLAITAFRNIGTLVLAILILAFGALLFYPFFEQLDPSYREIAAICTNIKAGMSYQDVETKYGSLVAPAPSTYLDSQGNGQAWLSETVQSDTSCNVQFRSGKVVSSQLLTVGL